METKVIEEKENPLFNRKEIILEVSSEISPKNEEVLKTLSEKYSASEGQIIIQGIHGKFGTHTFKISALIYNTIVDREKTEVKTKKQREAERKAAEETAKAEAEAKKKVEEEKKAAEEAAKAEAEKPAEEESKPEEENKTEEKTE